MDKKYIIVLLTAILPLLSCAQHLNFMDILMNGSISDFEKSLMKKGVERFYRYNNRSKYIHKDYNGEKHASYKSNLEKLECVINISSTPYSDNVYSASMSFYNEDQKLLENIYYQVIGEMIEKYGFKKEDNKRVYSNRFGEINVYLDKGLLNILFKDKENYHLREAEEWLDKKICKRLQKKYKNPLFYDKNPRFK